MIVHVAIDGRLRKLVLELNPQDGEFRLQDGRRNIGGVGESARAGNSLFASGRRSYRCVLDQGGEEPAIFLDGQRMVFASKTRDY